MWTARGNEESRSVLHDYHTALGWLDIPLDQLQRPVGEDARIVA